MSKRITTIALLLLLVATGSQLSARAQASQKKESKAANQQRSEFYFGSSIADFDGRVWFLSLDLARFRGRLFRRPEALELANVKVSDTGRITFRTERDFGGVIYQFEGEPGSKGITGRFDSIRAEPNTDEELLSSYPVVLEKVTLVQNPQSRIVSGVYSNVQYIEESGDLLGEELIIFWRGNELRGIFSSYEGGYTEPIAILDVSLSGTDVKFRVVSQGGEQNYAGTFSRNRLQLRCTDANTNPDFSRSVLLRKGEVRSILEKRTGSIR